MFSHWAYVFLGANNSGKTSIQRHLADELCDKLYTNLPRNKVLPITHPNAPAGVHNAFFANRSFQEQSFNSVAEYFNEGFVPEDLCFLSSHTQKNDLSEVEEIVGHLKIRFYNVAGIFMSNGNHANSDSLAMLPWTEVLWIENPARRGAAIDRQLEKIARRLARFVLGRLAVS